MIPLQLVTRWNVYGVAPNRGYIQVNKNEGIHEMPKGYFFVELEISDPAALRCTNIAPPALTSW
jgi:hypothetical protein